MAPVRLVVAQVRGLHGLNGAVRVEVLTDRPEARFATGAVLHVEGDSRPLTIIAAQPVEDHVERGDNLAVAVLGVSGGVSPRV